MCVVEHDGYLEGAADGLVGAGRNDGEADGRVRRATAAGAAAWAAGLAGGGRRSGGLGLLVQLLDHGGGGVGGRGRLGRAGPGDGVEARWRLR